MESSRTRGDQWPRLRIPDNPQRTPTSLRTSQGSLECSCRHRRPKLTACSWLLSSPPTTTAGNVNRNVETCAEVLFTNIRPPCIPTASKVPERLILASSDVVIPGFTLLLNDRSKILPKTSGAIPDPLAEILTMISRSRPRENSAVIADPVPADFTAAVISSLKT